MSDSRLISRHPVDLFTRQHDLLLSELMAYTDLSPIQVGEKAGLIRKIEEEVRKHIEIQEELFCPALLALKDPRIQERVDKARIEHRLLESMTGDLRRAAPGAGADLAVTVLRSFAERHLAFEENKLFPLASRVGRVGLNQMGLEIEERWMGEDRY